MTGNVLFDALLIFLIAYAMIHICHEIAEWLLRRFSVCHPKDFMVLSLWQGEESLELFVRCALKRSIEQRCALFIIDGGLDETEKTILWRLVDPYDHVVISTEDELLKKIKTAESVNAKM